MSGTDKMFAKITQTRVTGRFREGQGRRRHTVTAELHSLGGQNPYFSITMGTYRQAGNGPALAPSLRWHLVSTDGPMHYAANAAYWAGLDKEWCRGGKGDPPNREYFDSTALWGALPGDAARHPMDAPAMDRAELSAVLAARLPALLAPFRADMDRLFGTEAPEMLAGVAEAFAFGGGVQ